MSDSKQFKNSQEAAFRRIVRNKIKSGPFTKSERDVALAFFNHWFFHRTSAKKVVHPGRKKLARKANVTPRTVTNALRLLRFHKAIIAVDHLAGLHGNATEYVVDVDALFYLCDFEKSDPRVNGWKKVPSDGMEKISTRSCDVVPFPSQKIKSNGGGK